MPARADAASAPHADLLDMRRGTAHFARLLNDLSDAEIAASPTLRQILAEIGLEARALALEVKSLRGNLTDEETNLEFDIHFASSLPIHALRYLFTHSALHLNVELRDLEDVHWPSAIQIPKQRAVQIWHSAKMLRR